MKNIIIIILTLLSITINAQGIRLNSKQSVIDSTRLNATGDSLYYYQNGVVLRVEGITGAGGGTSYNNISETADTVFITGDLNVDANTLRVDATTNRVGIGTSSPTQKLEVAGNVLVTTSGSTQPLKTFEATYKQFSVDYPSSPSIYTTQINFAVFGRIQYEGNYGYLDIINRSPFSSSGMRFFTNNTERMRITFNGNVGIGTSSPAEKLDVRGRIEIQEQTDPSTAGSGLGTIYANSSNSKLFYRDDNGNNYDLTSTATTSDSSWTNSGTVTYLTDGGDKVGIGTSSPTANLTVVGDTILLKNQTNGKAIIKAEATSNPAGFIVSNVGNSALAVTAGGNSNFLFDESKSFLIQARPRADVLAASGALNAEVFEATGTGEIYMRDVYSDLISGTTRDLYIKDDGQLGYISSTAKSKTNIYDLNNVDFIYNLNPVSFNYRKQNDKGEFTDEFYDKTSYGLIAEEVVDVADYMVYYDELEDGGFIPVGVNYSELITPMLKAIQQQKDEIDQLKTLITDLTNRIQILENK